MSRRNRRLTFESLDQRNLLCGNAACDCDIEVIDPPVDPGAAELGGAIRTDVDVDHANRVTIRGQRCNDGSLPRVPHPTLGIEIGAGLPDDKIKFLPVELGRVEFVPIPLADPPVGPVAPLPGFIDDEPLDDVTSDIDQAIQEVSKELSRLQNQILNQNQKPQPVPPLRDLPYINRLFHNTAPVNDTTLMTVTPRIIIQEESTD